MAEAFQRNAVQNQAARKSKLLFKRSAGSEIFFPAFTRKKIAT